MSRSDLKLIQSAMSLVHKEALKEGFSKVALLSGGGSGHEYVIPSLRIPLLILKTNLYPFSSRPAHSGYIGVGGLSAVVCGQVYSSPTRDAIYSTLLSLKADKVLLIVKNYTGDRINFGLAAEMARTNAGKEIDVLVVADDIALLDSGVAIGARGVAGVVLVHKIVGAAAESGRTLEEVKEIGTKVANLVKTYGVALSSCTLPSATKPMNDMEENHMEIGLGIHGEKGLGSRPKASVDEIVADLLASLVKHTSFKSSDSKPVAVLLNNLGAATQMEMGVIARSLLRQLSDLGFSVERFFCGQGLTSMETVGISISLLPLDSDPLLLELLDAPTTMPAWLALGDGRVNLRDNFVDEEEIKAMVEKSTGGGGNREKGPADASLCSSISKSITSVCNMLKEKKDFLTDLDSKVGDGDLGTNLAAAASEVLRSLPAWSNSHPATLLTQLAIQLDTSLGGTSGPLYSIFFLNLANHLASLNSSPTATDWATAAMSGANGINRLGGAEKGDRTMMDALLPAVEALKNGETLSVASSKATEGSTGTADLLPKKGRSSYLQERALGIVDPGSAAIDLILQELLRSLH